MYICSRYYRGDVGDGVDVGIMTMGKFSSLYRAIKVEVSAVSAYLDGKETRQLKEFLIGDEFLSIVDDSFLGDAKLFTEDSEFGVKMDIYAYDGYKLVNIYSEDKNRPFFVQIRDIDDF